MTTGSSSSSSSSLAEHHQQHRLVHRQILWFASEIAAVCGMHPFCDEKTALQNAATRMNARVVEFDEQQHQQYQHQHHQQHQHQQQYRQQFEKENDEDDEKDKSDDDDDDDVIAVNYQHHDHLLMIDESSNENESDRKHKVEQVCSAGRRNETHTIRKSRHQPFALRSLKLERIHRYRGPFLLKTLTKTNDDDDDDVCSSIDVGGRPDGRDKQGRVVEIKMRTRWPFVTPLPIYDIIQLHIYMFLTDTKSAKLVERVHDEETYRTTILDWDDKLWTMLKRRLIIASHRIRFVT